VFVALPRDILLRVVALIAAALCIRDGVAGLRGVPLVIIKNYDVRSFEGRTGKVVAIFVLLVGISLLWLAWAGWPG
jgi:hypothetical protein